LPASAASVSAGAGFACAILADQTVWCWGNNQYVLPTATSTPVQVKLAGGAPLLATSLSAGLFHACASVPGGGVVCWGLGGEGQLGTQQLPPGGSTFDSTFTPVTVPGVTGATSVTVGDYHSCAIVTGGQVWCWGRNDEGQLGRWTTSTVDPGVPAPVVLLGGVTMLSAGGGTTCAITNGTQFCWGDNLDGQVGAGTSGWNYSHYTFPIPTSTTGTPGTLTDIASGTYGNCEVLGGAAYCQGFSDNDSLGTTNGTNAYPRAIFAGGDPVVQIANGDTTTCARTSTGHVVCVGAGSTTVTRVY
jgi:alpha-tubulin suppressor-like RCC1 family protein